MLFTYLLIEYFCKLQLCEIKSQYSKLAKCEGGLITYYDHLQIAPTFYQIFRLKDFY